MKQDTGTVQLFYETHGHEAGNGRPWIVFSHSLACTSEMWRPQIDSFARTHRVLLFDTRGHGRSDCPEGPYTMEELGQDAADLLKALNIDNAHFVGLSMGGMIGQELALNHPEMVVSLTIADSTSRWPPGAIELFAGRARQGVEAGMDSLVKATLERWFTPAYHRTNPEDVAKIGDMIRSTPVTGYAGCSHAIPRINYTHRLKEISCPVLVLVGAQDAGTVPALSYEIHENCPGSELFEIENASHLSNVEQPEAFNRVLSEFLKRQEGPALPA
ncbi:MAG: alpha/beta fold hydrolase [Pseudomonadota bacterium]